MLQQRRNPEWREQRRQSSLNISKETREKLRSAAGNMSPEHKARLSEAGRHRKLSPQARRNMGKAQKRRFDRPGEREKSRRGRLRQRFPKEMTEIERALYVEMKKRRLKFEMHKSMFGRWQPDFVFESARLIVQADGDYWHSTPKTFASDYGFNARAASEGWTVWRFAESKILSSPSACAKSIARFVRAH